MENTQKSNLWYHMGWVTLIFFNSCVLQYRQFPFGDSSPPSPSSVMVTSFFASPMTLHVKVRIFTEEVFILGSQKGKGLLIYLTDFLTRLNASEIWFWFFLYVTHSQTLASVSVFFKLVLFRATRSLLLTVVFVQSENLHQTVP